MQFLDFAIEYDLWATEQLLTFCCRQAVAVVEAPGPPGTYGSVLATFRHLIGSAQGYLSGMGMEVEIRLGKADEPSLEELAGHLRAVRTAWEDYAAGDITLDRRYVLDQGTYEAPAVVMLGQFVHHGNDHRSHINTVLTAQGVTPPDLDVWAYGEARGVAGPLG